VDGERKTVTVLFADIKGSVELFENLDVEEAREILDPALRLMVDAVVGYEGYVVQTTGDGIYALFGAPAAYQDHPRRAVHAGLAMQTGLKSYADRLVHQGKPPVIVRVGINTGEVILRALDTGGRLEYSGVGHSINLGSRLQTSAPLGSIAISERTRQLVEGYFDVRPLAPMVMKGVRDPVAAFEVAGTSELRRHLQIAMRRGLSKFVGREAEMQVLQNALGRALGSQGQIVATVTTAGTGKSRLLYEFLATLPVDCRVLDAYAVTHGKTMPWMPVIELLTKYFDIGPDDSVAERREKISCALSVVDGSLADKAPFLLRLLGASDGPDALERMDPQVRRSRIIDAIVRLLLVESRKSPLVLIFEDLHWADEQTRLLLDTLVDRMTESRILLLVTCRPEVTGLWGQDRNYREIRLQPLGADGAAELLEFLLPNSDHLWTLKQYVIEKTAGNPFFIEEIVNALFEDGTLVRRDTIQLTKQLHNLRLPQTVQDTLAERIDKLPISHKDLLQTLAVIGANLPMDLVAAVCEGTTAHLDRMLSDLQRADFIYAQPGHERSTYSFKHALTLEVAYNSLVTDRRRRLHERVAEAIEEVYAERLPEYVSQLAYHYARTSNAAKAIHYLSLAGEAAVQRSAHGEAVEHLKAAIQLLELLPEETERVERGSRLWLALGVSLQTTLGYAANEVGPAYERARELSARCNDALQFISAIRGHSNFFIVRADYATAFSLGQQMGQVQDDSVAYIAEQSMILGLCCLYTGDFEAGERYFQQSVSSNEAATRLDMIQYSGHYRALSLSYLALDEWFLGFPDRSVKYNLEGISLGRELAISITIAQAVCMTGIVAMTRRDYSAAEEYIDQTIPFAIENGFPYWQILGTMLKGWLVAWRTGDRSSLDQFNECVTMYRGIGAKIGVPWFLGMRAEIAAAWNETDKALQSLDEALAEIEDTNERQYEAELHRLRGETLLQRDGLAAADEALGCFNRSLAVARRQSAKSLELRTVGSMARLLLRRGRPQDALETFAPVLEWFTEGFETPDLRDAITLHQELLAAASVPVSHSGDDLQGP
jgi:adenylate cyclase